MAAVRYSKETDVADRSYLDWPFFSDEHRAFAERIGAWCVPNLAENERSEDDAIRHYAKALGSSGMLEPLRTLDVRTMCLAREHLAYHDALADFAFAMQGLGSAPVSRFGTPEQRENVLPGILAGTTIGAFALSEKEAGSDVAATATSARRDGDTYAIDGEKTWISNAGIAGSYVLFARTSSDGAKGLTAFIVPADTPGVSVTGRIDTISPHPLGTLRFENAIVPATSRVGEEGQGFKIAMATLDMFRATVGAAALGFARRALDETIRHVRERKLFGEPLAAMQLTQAAIAEMATRIDAAALLVYRAAWTKDRGAERITREAAMAKWNATETAAYVADRAVQLFGGRGVTRGEIVERIYRDVRALRIYEGASEIQQVVIARSVLG